MKPLLAGALLLSLAVITNGIAWKRGFYRPLAPGSRPTSTTLWTVGIGGLLFFGLQFAVGAITLLFFRPTTLSQIGWVSAIGMLVASLSLIAYKGRRLLSRPLSPHLKMGLLTLLLALPTAYGLGQLVEGLLGTVDKEQTVVAFFRKIAGQPLLPWVMGLGIVLLGPVAEEILFRGLLQSWLRKRMGALAAIFLSSLLFVAVHLTPSQGMANLTLVAVLFPFACFLGYLYERQRSLWAPVTLHCSLNGLTIATLALSP
ncbi:MAG: lysostaphin resistance A-like protein [Parachlamydiales bacterium]